MTSIFSRNRAKNHSHNKLKRKQLPRWSCFAFITRNIDQNTATKSLYAHKTTENSHTWKSPYNALQAQYWINAPHVCQEIVSLLIPYRFKLQNGYFDNKYLWNWCDKCCFYNWININLSQFSGFFYADAEQSALEIRTSLFFFFFMVVANCNASCYWLHVHCSQW